GRGLHGDVVLNDLDLTIDTGSQVFPVAGSQTMTGGQVTVTDGIFEFGTVRVPSSRKLTVVGPNPARIFVRGNLEILGTLEFKGSAGETLNGANTPEVAGFPQHPAGGLGGAGGPGAGRGGNGGGIDPTVSILTTAWSSNAILDGEGGEGVGGPTGLGVGGGIGGLHHPSNLPPPGALPGDVCARTLVCVSLQSSSGGGGGGYRTAGTQGFPGTPGTGQAFLCTTCPPDFGPVLSAGGPAVVVDPTLDPDAIPSSLIGGSGGAGAGTNPWDTEPQGAPTCLPPPLNTVCVLPATTVRYQTGCGGGGGGGAAQVQAGGDIIIQPPGTIDGTGGKGGTPNPSPPPGLSVKSSGGGGGSGGAILLQAGDSIQVPPAPAALVKVRGGLGGGVAPTPIGGTGGDGYVRVESDPAPGIGSFNAFVDPSASVTTGTFVPFLGSPANFSGAASTWIDTIGSGSLLVTYDHFVLTAA
ncbi:MAG: hypothetical protein ACREIU_12685, partial [Planctomycetota bacterium]